jgi:hypothetical protein
MEDMDVAGREIGDVDWFDAAEPGVLFGQRVMDEVLPHSE